MINKNYLKLIRSDHRFDNNNFIYNISAKRVLDSIDLLNLKINKALEIGINDNVIYKYINSKFDKIKILRTDLCISKSKKKSNYEFEEMNLSKIKFKTNYYDLIYSNLFLHLIIGFENFLELILKSLKSNGFFISVIPHKESMFQLLNSMYETDLYLYKGAYQRINPSVDINKILLILKNLNFDTPTIFTDTISIEYSNFANLLMDIKRMNLSYCHNDKKQNFENKKYFNILEKFYKKNYYDQGYPLEIKINILSAWKK